MKKGVSVLIVTVLVLLSSCEMFGEKAPEMAFLRIEASQDGLYYAVEVDGEFVGKVLYTVSPFYPDYVELQVEVGEHPIDFAAYGSPTDFFIGAPPAEGPAHIIVTVPEDGTSVMLSNPINYPVF